MAFGSLAAPPRTSVQM